MIEVEGMQAKKKRDYKDIFYKLDSSTSELHMLANAKLTNSAEAYDSESIQSTSEANIETFIETSCEAIKNLLSRSQ